MKRIRKEYLVFIGLIILVLLIFGITHFKSNKAKYDRSKIHVTFDSETEEAVVDSSIASTQEDTATESLVEETEQATEEIGVAETEVVTQSIESETEEIVGDAYAVNSSNIYDVISSILSDSPNLEYCTDDFTYDESIKTDLEIFRVSEVENHFDEGYVLGYVETPVDDLLYRFDFTLDGNKLASLTFSEQ